MVSLYTTKHIPSFHAVPESLWSQGTFGMKNGSRYGRCSYYDYLKVIWVNGSVRCTKDCCLTFHGRRTYETVSLHNSDQLLSKLHCQAASLPLGFTFTSLCCSNHAALITLLQSQFSLVQLRFAAIRQLLLRVNDGQTTTFTMQQRLTVIPNDGHYLLSSLLLSVPIPYALLTTQE